VTTADVPHYCEAGARVRLGAGFFRPDSRPARDLGVLLGLLVAREQPLEVLDAMAGCGIRALRYGMESGARLVWANDADPDRRALLESNLAGLPAGVSVRCTSRSVQRLFAELLLRRRRFSLLDLDAFGSAGGVLPLALEAVAFGGILYLGSSDGRSPTGHDRTAAVRRLGAAARAHPASWELALRLQLGMLARSAWTQGRGLVPLLSFSEGRTFRTAVRLSRLPAAGEEWQLGMIAHCHGCGDQQVQSLRQLGRWQPCACPASSPGGPAAAPPLAVSGPLWIGPLQHGPSLMAMASLPCPGLSGPGRALLARLAADEGSPARCWPLALIGRQLGSGPPPRDALIGALRDAGFRASASGLMAAQVRSDAPWRTVLAVARSLTAGRLLDR
jgi:tRNA (guanine26-N2/guanine27-N2)-dimethyltransferase